MSAKIVTLHGGLAFRQFRMASHNTRCCSHFGSASYGHAFWSPTSSIVPGRWVGPWMLCKSLEALFSPLGCERPMGLHLHVACGSGGGAPELNTAAIRAQMAASATVTGAESAACQELPSRCVSCRGTGSSSESGADANLLPVAQCPQLRNQTIYGVLDELGADGSPPVPLDGLARVYPDCWRSADCPQMTGDGFDPPAYRVSQLGKQLHTEELTSLDRPSVVEFAERPSARRSAASRQEDAQESVLSGGPHLQPDRGRGLSFGPHLTSLSSPSASGSGAAAGPPEAAEGTSAVTQSHVPDARHPTLELASRAAGCRGPMTERVSREVEGPSGRSSGSTPVLMLVPLTLGMDKVSGPDG